jgi:peptidoglycan/LPS O-acetylase OafA/YrhL
MRVHKTTTACVLPSINKLHNACAVNSREHTYPALDWVRLLLALLVLVQHAAGIVSLKWPWWVFLGQQVLIGRTAVNMFFVLSGYLIVMSWHREPHLGRYLWKRVLRVFPGYLVAFVLSVTVFGWVGASNRHLYADSLASVPPFEWVRAVLTLAIPPDMPTYIRSAWPGELNASMWTLAYEFACYLGVAVLGVAGAFRFKWAAPAVLVLCLAMYTQFRSQQNVIELLEAFAFGATLYQWREKVPLEWAWAGASLILWAGSFFLHHAAVAAPIFLGYPLMVAALKIRVAPPKLDISYGTYIYGWPVLQLAVQFGPRTVASVLAIGVLGTLPLALLSFVLIERPAMRLRNVTPRTLTRLSG